MAFSGKIAAISHACALSVNRSVYRELHRRCFDIELLAPSTLFSGGYSIKAEPALQGDPPTHFRALRGKHGRLFWFSGLQEFLSRVKPEAVILEADTASLMAIACANWKRRHGSRLYCRTNENLSWQIGDAVARVGLREAPHATAKTLMNFCVRGAVDAVLTTSNSAAQLYCQAGFRRSLFVPMGIDRELFRYRSRVRKAARSALGIDRSECVIAYFGRMVPEKGVDTLVRALGLLKNFPWRLLVNRFEMSSSYTKVIDDLIAEVNIDNRVIWARSRHGEIAKLMMATDITVLPSLTTPKWIEQYGRVVPEAMACGNLVVVSDSGAPKELVGEAGLVFPEGDHAALATCLREIYASPKACLARRKAAIRRVDSHLSIEAEADAYERLLND